MNYPLPDHVPFLLKADQSEVWTKRSTDVERTPENRVVEWARQEFIFECVKEHNRCRELHGVPPLELCEQLSDDAQIWADRLAESKVIEYSSVDGRGENILMSSAGSRGGFTGNGVTKAWYDKGRKYNYKAVEPADMAYTGSFTQVIWKSTKKVGIGMSRSECGRIVAVARYWPRGNVPGEIRENVKPLMRLNPFDLPTFSKTREEANLNVQTALVAPEICAGVAKFYAAPIKEVTKSHSNFFKHAKMNGLYSPRVEKKPKVPSNPTTLCPNGRLIQVCCGAPSLAESGVTQETPSPTVVRTKPSRQSLKILSPSNLERENKSVILSGERMNIGVRRNPFNSEPDSTIKGMQINLQTLSKKVNQSAMSGRMSPLQKKTCQNSASNSVRSRAVSVRPMTSEDTKGHRALAPS